MGSLLIPSEISSNSVWVFQKVCELFKSMLDKNFGERFCIDGNCRTIFMVEIKLDGCKWGATPKIFHSEEEADKEAITLKLRYPFISECRVITRKEKESGLTAHHSTNG